jgi:hypothetical protein
MIDRDRATPYADPASITGSRGVVRRQPSAIFLPNCIRPTPDERNTSAVAFGTLDRKRPESIVPE